MRRLLLACSLALLALAALAPAALAESSGQGLYGPADDKVVTDAGFILIGGIPMFVLLMSMLQWRLDKRKQARTDAARARARRPEWRGGW